LLISSVEMPRSSFFGEDLHKTLYDKAAAYLFHIVSNHPFNDGNKRTGALTAILFLETNVVAIDFCEEEYEELVIQVAQSKKTKKEIADFFQGSKIKINKDV
jgi:death-on-curing protein